jgi:hypothetical protein
LKNRWLQYLVIALLRMQEGWKKTAKMNEVRQMKILGASRSLMKWDTV